MSNNTTPTLKIPFKEKLTIAFYGGFFLWIVSPIALLMLFFNNKAKAWSLFGDSATVTNSYNTTVNNYGSLGELAGESAEKYELNTSLFFALIKQESRWNPNAVSTKGARGLAQIMPSTAKEECGVEDPDSLFEPAVNLDCGARYLRKLINIAGDRLGGEGDVEEVLRLALASYNSGVNATYNRDSLHKFPETRNYVARIMNEVQL